MSMAELGLNIDSSAARGAIVDLDALADASQGSERAETRRTEANKQAETATRGMAAAINALSNLRRTEVADLMRAEAATRSMASAVRQLTEAESRQAGSAKRASDVAAYGAELDRLRAKYNPVFAASKAYETSLNELNMAHRVGAISAQEHGSALEQLNREYKAIATGADIAQSHIMGMARASGAAQANARNLSFQLIDIGQSIPLAFQSPLYALQNLGFQIAQIGQIYMGQGGMRQAMRDIIGQLGTFATKAGPAVVAVGAIAAAVVGLQNEINSAGGAQVSFMDTLLASFQLIGDGINSLLMPAIDAIAPGFSSVWEAVVSDVHKSGNFIINDVVGWASAVVTVAKGAWEAIPKMASGIPETLKGTWDAIYAGWLTLIAKLQKAWADFLHAIAERAPDTNVPGIGNPFEMVAGAAIGAGSAYYQADAAAAAARKEAANERASGAKAIEEGAGMLKKAIDDAQAAREAADKMDPMGDLFDELSSRAQANAAARAASTKPGGGGGGPSSADRAAERAAREAEREAERRKKAYDDMVMSGENFIANQQLEASAIGMTEEAANRLRYEFDFLADAQRQGIELTPDQADRLKELADQMAGTEAATDKLKDSFDFAQETARSFLSDFAQGLRNGEGLWRSFADAAVSSLDRITDKLLNEVLDAIFQVNSASSGGGGGIFGKIIGGIFGAVGGAFGGAAAGDIGNFSGFNVGAGNVGLGTGGLYANGGVFSGGREITAFAKGGIVSSPTLFPMAGGRTGLMGEAGDEGILPLRRGRNGKLGVEASGASGGAGRVRITLGPGLEAQMLDKAARQSVELDRRAQADTLKKTPGAAAAGFRRRPSLRGA